MLPAVLTALAGLPCLEVVLVMLAAHAGPAVLLSLAAVLVMLAGLAVLAFLGCPEAVLVMLAGLAISTLAASWSSATVLAVLRQMALNQAAVLNLAVVLVAPATPRA